MYSRIESIGRYYPSSVVATSSLLEQMQVEVPNRLQLLTGIKYRRFCSPNENSLSMALEATASCLKYSQFRASEIEMIINCSISRYIDGGRHCYEPSLSLWIKKGIGNSKAINFDISNACAGMITGVMVADNFIRQGLVNNCLVVSGECISSLSKHALKTIDSSRHPEMASLTVGDGAAAVLIERTNTHDDAIAYAGLQTMSCYSDLCMGYQSSTMQGAYMQTNMQGIHEAAIEHSPFIIEKALNEIGLEMDDIDFVIPHQTAKMSILAGEKRYKKYFKKSAGSVIINLEEYGNTASTTHFTTLYKMLEERRFSLGDTVMLISFASGLVIGVVVIRIGAFLKRY